MRAALLDPTPRPKGAPGDPNLLKVDEFAWRLGIAESSVYELIKKGLPSFCAEHVGRRIEWDKALAWLREGGPKNSRIAKRLSKSGGGRDR